MSDPKDGDEALEKAIESERTKDASFDEKATYWNELYAQGLTADKIADKMKEKFDE